MGEDNRESQGTPVSNVVQIDEERIRGHLDRIVRSSVEETLNGLLDAEADRLVGADRYQRTDQRRDYRSGHYERKLHTRAGEVKLKVPKLRRQALDTAIIERYRRRESSVEEALMEMYLAGVSVRRVEDITEADNVRCFRKKDWVRWLRVREQPPRQTATTSEIDSRWLRAPATRKNALTPTG